MPSQSVECMRHNEKPWAIKGKNWTSSGGLQNWVHQSYSVLDRLLIVGRRATRNSQISLLLPGPVSQLYFSKWLRKRQCPQPMPYPIMWKVTPYGNIQAANIYLNGTQALSILNRVVGNSFKSIWYMTSVFFYFLEEAVRNFNCISLLSNW